MEQRMNHPHTNYCPECRVYVDDCLCRCPLCGKKLTEQPAENGLYPGLVQKHYIDRRSFSMELSLFLSLLFIGGAVVLNLIFWEGTLWFLAVAATVLYAWILVGSTIFSEIHPGGKCFLQLVGIMAMMLVFDYLSGWLGWSYEYVLPTLLVTCVIYIDFYSWIHKSKWRDNIVYALLFVGLGFLPLILYLNGLTHALAPVIMTTIGSGLTILGILKFTVRYIAGEMKRRLHV